MLKAVVMAGGEGTRLRPLTDDVPKPFIPVSGKPAIEYGLEAAVRAGVEEILITTYYKPQRLIERLGGGTRLGARIFYSVEDEALGTAGGVAKARSWLSDTFIVMSGDVLADVDLNELVAYHRKVGAEVTMALTTVDDPTQFGIVGLAKDGRIERFQEKPKKEEAFSNLVNAGIYVLEPSALAAVPATRAFDFSKDLFPHLLKEGRKLHGHSLQGVWLDVGRPADLLRAARLMGERHHAATGGTYRHASAGVEPGARVATTDLYENARVGAGAVVEDSVLFAGVSVHERAVVKRSLVAAGAVIEEGAHVEDSVLGAGSRVPAGKRAIGAKLDARATFV